MATIDHLVSRYHPERWVTRETTKVLACYECNSRRAREETANLPKEELYRRGKGFSLNPKGKPIFVETLASVEDVIDKMKANGIIPMSELSIDEFQSLEGKEVDIVEPKSKTISYSWRGLIVMVDKEKNQAEFVAATGQPAILFHYADITEIAQGENVPVIRLRG
jgi:hypothetical protein